ncbi:hypothetical protein [Parerythrobacter lacustris]|uniref:Uncharacterized protein n=1 Tax=Parerythrobacter lacustris TaxID=2969984 RepID=A0ABT1XUS3_9SPHN|nr:hypothetical protein [Parerythrobacter lacustris]MCR2834661.1 hypothetical protein [Parerythrobacter lacustris]
MKRSQTKAVFVTSALALSLAGTLSLVQSPAEAQSTPAQSEDEQAVVQFLSEKRDIQARRSAQLDRRGARSDAQQLRQLTRALNLESPRPFASISPEQSGALQESLIEDAVQLLLFLDMKPGRVQRLQATGQNPLQAAINFVKGTSTLQEQALLSDHTVLATIQSVVVEDLGDGFGSTVTLDVVDRYIGRTERTLQFRQRSGSEVIYAHDIREGDTGTYVFSLSRGLYDEAAVSDGATPVRQNSGRPEYYAVLGTRYAASDGIAIPDRGTGQATPLSTIQIILAPLASAKRSAE